jgi:membrane-bound lytic murein transglycosylase D
MKKHLLFILTFFLFQLSKAAVMLSEQQPPADTAVVDEKKVDQAIDEVISSKRPPSKEKVQYFSQVTRYGFKNLFPNYSYNPSQPYDLQVNSNAAGFIQDYIKTHGTYLTQMKGWGKPYFNLIEYLLQQYGLPKELKYIAVIESNLKSGAVSLKGAGGPWQFMPETARQMGLTINAYTDERTDYYKSTNAASKYLLQLYGQLHDWLLVMAAYNGGPARVFAAIQRSGSRNFWDLQYYLPEESRTYVKRFIATHFIMEGNTGNNGEWAMQNGKMPASFANMTTGNGYADPYDIPLNLTEKELAGIEVQTISGKFNSLVIAKSLTMDIQQFNRLNPSFDNIITNNGNYDLRLPEDKMQLFLAAKYQILNECVQILLTNDTVITNPVIYPKSPYDKYGSKKTSKKKRKV